MSNRLIDENYTQRERDADFAHVRETRIKKAGWRARPFNPAFSDSPKVRTISPEAETLRMQRENLKLALAAIGKSQTVRPSAPVEAPLVTRNGASVAEPRRVKSKTEQLREAGMVVQTPEMRKAQLAKLAADKAEREQKARFAALNSAAYRSASRL